MMRSKTLLGLALATAGVAKSKVLPSSYDVSWTGAGVNGSQSSMPVGGGDLGLNVWVEDGDVLFYVGKSGCFDENNSLLKLGRVRLTLDPNPFAEGQTFVQKLCLEDGYVQLYGDNYASQIDIWIDVYNSIIHVDGNLSQSSMVTAAFESWRYENHNLSLAEQALSSWNGAINDTLYTYADNTTFYGQSSVLSYHRNGDPKILDASLAQQNLSGHNDVLYDTLTDNTFGLLMSASGFTAGNVSMGSYANTTYKGWEFTGQNQTEFSITLTTYQNQTSSVGAWQSALIDLEQNAGNNTHDISISWWNSFWQRSHLLINEDASESDTGFQVGRNYQLFRYMLGCNAFSNWPSKFNGALFTFDPYYIDNTTPFTPDFRGWGGGTWTAQNQRLMYWPLFKTGDLDVLLPQLDFYKNILDVNKLRGQSSFGINEAFYSEHIDGFGLSEYFN